MFKRFSEPAAFDFSQVILSFVFVGLGLLFMYLVGRKTILQCDRIGSNQNCIIKISWMDLVRMNTRTIGEVRSAAVEENCDDEGCTYRVRIGTDQGPLYLGEVYSSGESEKRTNAELINAFAQGRSNTLEVSNGGGIWVFFPLIFVVVGVWIVLPPLVYRLRKVFDPDLP